MSLAQHGTLAPTGTYLNQGAYGACPRIVLEAQSELRARLEREPVRFFAGDLEGLLDVTRRAVGELVGAQPGDLAFVANATVGVNTVVASYGFERGDEALVTDHGYNACSNAVQYWATRAGARVALARVPFPVARPDDVVAAILASVTARTRLAVIDHVTSPTGIVFPIERIVR